MASEPAAQTPTLRPLGVGDIVDRVINLYRAYPRPFIVMAAIPAIIVAILQRAAGLTRTFDLNDFVPTINARGEPVLPGVSPQQVGVAAAVVGLVATVIALIQAGAIVHAASRRYMGREIDLGMSVTAGLRAAPKLLLMAILAIVFFTIATVAPLLAIAVAVGLTGVTVLFLLYLPVFFFLIPFVLISWFVVVPAAIVENAGPVAALRRSWRLVAGARWRAVGLLFLFAVLNVVIGVLFTTVFLVSFVSDPTLRTVLQEAANVGAAAIETPLLWMVVVVFYYDLRVRKEAFDLQLAAESLPREG